MDAKGDTFLHAEVRHLTGEGRGPVEPKRAGWTGKVDRPESEDLGIFQHRASGDRGRSIAQFLFDDRRVGNL